MEPACTLSKLKDPLSKILKAKKEKKMEHIWMVRPNKIKSTLNRIGWGTRKYLKEI